MKQYLQYLLNGFSEDTLYKHVLLGSFGSRVYPQANILLLIRTGRIGRMLVLIDVDVTCRPNTILYECEHLVAILARKYSWFIWPTNTHYRPTFKRDSQME